MAVRSPVLMSMDNAAPGYNAIVKILKTPDMKQRLELFGAEPGGFAPEQFAVFIKSETAKWAKVVKATGATAE